MTDYERLIRDFCLLTGLGDQKAIAGGVPLEVDGVTCSIAGCRRNEGDAFVLYVEFGAVPAGREAAVFEELLAQNFIGAPQAGVMFSFSSVAKSVICVQHLRASALTAQGLVNMLRYIAEKAVEWRGTYFLKAVEGRASASKPSSGAGRALGKTEVTGGLREHCFPNRSIC